MVQLNLLPTPPGAYPPGICNFFLSWLSIPHPLGSQKETIPHPRARDGLHMRGFGYYL